MIYDLGGVLTRLGVSCLTALIIFIVFIIILVLLIHLIGSIFIVLIKYLPATVAGILVWYYTRNVLYGIVSFFFVLVLLLAWKKKS